MRFGMWPEEDIEARYSFGLEEREDSRAQKPIRWRMGGVSLHEGRPLEGEGGARLMILLVGGTVLLVLLAGILGIMDAIGLG
jgi:hypothetical protein